MDNALNKIIEQIKKNSEAEIERLRFENEKQCSDVVKHFNKLVEEEKQQLLERIDLFKQKLSFKVDSENLILKSKRILETKQKVLLQVKKGVVEALCSNEGYFKFMERLIERNLSLTGGSFVLFYGKLDYVQFLENLKFKSSDVLTIKKSDEFDRGAIVSCVDFEVNLEVEQIVSNHISKFEPEVLAILTPIQETRRPAL